MPLNSFDIAALLLESLKDKTRCSHFQLGYHFINQASSSAKNAPSILNRTRLVDALAALVTACELQSPAGYRNDLAGNARGGWRGKEDHGLGDIFAFGPTLQIFWFHRGNV